jgi:hypothetical protein
MCFSIKKESRESSDRRRTREHARRVSLGAVVEVPSTADIRSPLSVSSFYLTPQHTPECEHMTPFSPTLIF